MNPLIILYEALGFASLIASIYALLVLFAAFAQQ